jgi:hypothetical protein
MPDHLRPYRGTAAAMIGTYGAVQPYSMKPS